MISLNRTVLTFFFFAFSCLCAQITQKVYCPDNGDGTYKNPIIFSDYSDPDVIRSGDDYFMVSSSFQHSPSLPLLHSKDLVNWRVVNHIVPKLDYGHFGFPQHGNGVWAPALRFHDGIYYVYFGDPDYGIFMSKTKNPLGRWEPLTLVKVAKGWIDPCPLWDDDGSMYLVHAWANSRSGIKSILTLNKLSKDGKQVLDEGTIIFDGTKNHPTIEGPKFYKRNGYYYIFAPAGGVTKGWQTILRSKNVYGPYEDKIVLEQGTTPINGPHQGAWVETQTGESWFIHFQDRDAYGRVVNLEPVRWVDDWPLMGIDRDGNGIGEPVLTFRKPDTGKNYDPVLPEFNDEFNSANLNLYWQWQANCNRSWYLLSAKTGHLRLFSQRSDSINLWPVPSIIAQKFPAPEFTVTTKLDLKPGSPDEKTGLIILGLNYASLYISRTQKGFELTQSVCLNADKSGREETVQTRQLSSGSLYLKAYVREGGICSFAFSSDGKKYELIGNEFTARKGKWVGAKIGLYSVTGKNAAKTGYTDFDYFRFNQ